MRITDAITHAALGLLPPIGYPVLRGPLRGARLILGSLAGGNRGASVYIGRVEPRQTDALRRLLGPGKVLLDIGANVGYYSILGARLVGGKGLCVAVEPSVRNLSFLHRHLEMNRLRNVVVIAAACSDSLDFMAFAAGANPAEGHLTEGGIRTRGAGDDGYVATITVDRLVGMIGRAPDAMKIDVEGAELKVLVGARETLRRSRPAVLVSVHSVKLRQECLGFLEDEGYRALALGDTAEESMEFLALHAGGAGG